MEEIQHTNQSQSHGEATDFWTRYNSLPDKYDADMLERLNRSLDVLLIFVSRYSYESRARSAHLAVIGWSLLSDQHRFHSRHSLRPERRPLGQNEHPS